MKKTFRSILAGALAVLAVSCYDDTALRELISDIDARLTELETKLNTEVGTINGKIDALDAAYKLADQGLTTSINNLLTQLDALDKEVDGKIKVLEDANAGDAAAAATLSAAIEEIKKTDKDLADAIDELVKADASLAGKDTEILAAIAGIGVTNVAKNEAGNVVLTFTDNTTLEVPVKPQEGLVTVVEEGGVKYWAVVENGQPKSLGVKVGNPTLEFQVSSDSELQFKVDGGEWTSTGVVIPEEKEACLLTDFYQGVEFDYDLWEEVVDDYYTLVFAGVEYQLPLYKVDNSVAVIRAGKTYFKYAEAKTIDVSVSGVSSMYVMTKPDGWRAKLADNKLTVTAPSEANIEAGLAEADGEILLHCTTSEGKCKIAKLAVATTGGFSLTLDEDGNLTIINPEVVTTTDREGDVITDFNDAYVGIVNIAEFEADPVEYVGGIQDNYAAMCSMISNWKFNTAEHDEEYNTIYTVGGAYEPGVYEVDTITTTVPKMYADWTNGQDIPAGPHVVWACPVDSESGMPRIDELVYAYYFPSVKATITEVSKTTTDIEVAVNVSGATTYYVGMATEEMLYGFPIDQFMQMQEGPFGYFQMALQWGAAEYAFQQMGTQFGGEVGAEMPATIKASDLNYGMPLMPNSKVYMWVFPVVDGLALTDYTYEKNLQPYIYEFATEGLSAGGSATVTFSNPAPEFTQLSVDIKATAGATMIYYNWYTSDAYNAMDEAALAADLLASGYASSGDFVNARTNSYDQNVSAGSEYFLASLAVDAEGKYGEVNAELFKARELVYSNTFTATFGETVTAPYSTGFKCDFPITVQGGTAAEYYYVFGTTQFTDEQLANLPLTYNYHSSFRSTTSGVAENMLKGQFAYAGETYYVAVVVESTTGEFSPVIKTTLTIPAE